MSKSKSKGTAFETACVRFLQSKGIQASRHPLYGAGDVGDIAGVPDWTLQCKNHRAMDLGDWCSGAEQQARHGNTRFWAVLHKRRMKSTSESYVTMTLETFAELIKQCSA